MTRNHDTPPAARTYRVWADNVRRMFQDVEAPDPVTAHEIARGQPEHWEDCSEVEGRDDYHLSDEVQDTKTEEYHHVGPGGDGYPGVPFERAVLRAVLSGGRDFDDERERTAAQHFALMAMHPDDVDGTGGGPGHIIADLAQFPDAGRYADLFAASSTLLRTVEAARGAFAERIASLAGERREVLRNDLSEVACHDIDLQAANYRQLLGWCDDAIADAAGRERQEHRLASDRGDARMRDRFLRYPSLHAEDRIRLALDILEDVSGEWDHDTLEHYPDGLASFDEFLLDLRIQLGSIRWTRPGRSPRGNDANAA